MSFSVSFSVVFLDGVVERLFRHFSRNGCHLCAFWETFCHVLEICGVLLDATPSAAKTNIFRFGRARVGTFSSSLPGLDSGCVFMRFYVIFFDFGSPLELLWAPLGAPFRAN